MRIRLVAALLVGACVSTPERASAQTTVTHTNGTTYAGVDVLGWVGDAMLIRRDGAYERIDRAAIATIQPKEPWDATKIDAQRAKVRAETDRTKALKLLEDALAHAPTGDGRRGVLADRAVVLQAAGRLGEAWLAIREHPDATLCESISSAARKRKAELDEQIARSNAAAQLRPLLLEAWDIGLIDGSSPAVVARLWELARSETARLTDGAKLNLCARCGGKTKLICGACGGSGKGERSRFGAGRCTKCAGGGTITCGQCSATGLVNAEFPEDVRRALPGYMQELRRAQNEGSVPGLVLQKQLFFPPSVLTEHDGVHQFIGATLRAGRLHDRVAERLPLRRGQWPTDPFDRARAPYVPAHLLGADPVRFATRWLTTVVELGGVAPVDAPFAGRRLDLGLPLACVVPSEEGLKWIRENLESAASGGGSLGAPLLAWLAAYPMRAMNGRLDSVSAGQWLVVAGRVQVPPADRLDQVPVFEAWDIAVVRDAVASR